MRLPVFTKNQVGVHGNLPGPQSQREDLIGQKKKILPAVVFSCKFASYFFSRPPFRFSNSVCEVFGGTPLFPDKQKAGITPSPRTNIQFSTRFWSKFIRILAACALVPAPPASMVQSSCPLISSLPLAQDMAVSAQSATLPLSGNWARSPAAVKSYPSPFRGRGWVSSNLARWDFNAEKPGAFPQERRMLRIRGLLSAVACGNCRPQPGYAGPTGLIRGLGGVVPLPGPQNRTQALTGPSLVSQSFSGVLLLWQ